MFGCDECGAAGAVRCEVCRKAWFCAECAGAAHDCAGRAAWPFEVTERPGRGRCWVATADVPAGTVLWTEAPAALAWLAQPVDAAEFERLVPWADGIGGDWRGQPKARHLGVAMARGLLASAEWCRRHRRTDWAGESGYARRVGAYAGAPWAPALASTVGWTTEAVIGLVEMGVANAFALRLWGHDFYDAACALYRLASFINTSCANKTTYMMAGARFVLLAEAPIAAGEEITIAYATDNYLCTCPIDHAALDADIERHARRMDAWFTCEALALADSTAAMQPCSPFGEAHALDERVWGNVRLVIERAPELLDAAIDGLRLERNERFFIRLRRFIDAYIRSVRILCMHNPWRARPQHLWDAPMSNVQRLEHVNRLISLGAGLLDVCAQADRPAPMRTSLRTLASMPLIGALSACFIGVERPTEQAELAEPMGRAADALWRSVSGVPADLDVFVSLRALAGYGDALHAYLAERRPAGPAAPFFIAA